jgi:hypothetical protein
VIVRRCNAITLRGLGRVYQPVYKDKRTGERKKTETWFIQYGAHGRNIRESSESTNKQDAITLLTRKWAHVDFTAGRLRLEPGETKNGQGRMFPLTPMLRAVLEKQREHTTADRARKVAHHPVAVPSQRQADS